MKAIPFDEQFAWLDEQTPDVDLVPLFDWYLRGTDLANVGLEGAPRMRPHPEGGVVAELEIVNEGLAGLPFDLQIRESPHGLRSQCTRRGLFQITSVALRRPFEAVV